MNQARLDQVVAGAVHRTLRRKVALTEDGLAPSLLELLTLIRDEEAADEEEDALLQAGLEGHFT